jgi:Tol biopolymer transport system component
MLLLQSADTTRLIDPSGQKQMLLSVGAGLRSIANASFTPDGRRIVFCSNDYGSWKIYSTGLDGQKRKTLTLKTTSSNYCLSPLLVRR